MLAFHNILLINPAYNDNYDKNEMYPSGAFLLMGTMLKDMGYNVKVIHILADKINNKKLKNIISNYKPDIVGLSVSTFQVKSARFISKFIKNIDNKITILAGGAHISALRNKIFDEFKYIDMIAIGEGEFILLDIVKGKELNKIPGLFSRNFSNILRPLANNLDHIPLPNLDLIDINKFSGASPVGAKPSMFIMASRGCPFNCTYCNKSVWGKKTRFRKPEAIIEEVKWLHGKYGVKEIFFQDDTFNLNRSWAENIFKLLIKNRLNKSIVYKTPFRANKSLVDKDLLKLAKEAGFWLIFYGVENGNQEMLDRMKKGLTIEEIKRAFKLTHQAGLKTIGSFIIGLPGETKNTIRDSFNLWKEIKPFHYGFSYATPFPGTEFEQTIRINNHLLSEDYDNYSFRNCVVRTDSLTKDDLIQEKMYLLKKINKFELINKKL